jgi:AraC-like DNA-binding protein/streptogramin lyase
VTSIKVSQDGTVWFATLDKGLLSYNPIEGTWKQYTRQDGVESQSINSLYISASGLLIAAGNEGLSYLQPGLSRFTPLYPRDNPNVLYATSDMRNIWYTTSKGLYRYNTHDGSTEYYGGEAGLHDGGFIAGSGFTSDDGRIWLGTYMGVTSFHPGNIQTNQYSPPAVLTDVTFRNRSRSGTIRPALRINLDDDTHESATPHRYNNVTFSYSALSYRVPSRNSYKIMLEGFDDDWIETDLSSTTYTNLPAGQYTFKVLSCNSDRIWSDTQTAFQFTIRPRIVFSNMAIAIYLLLVLLAGIKTLHYFNYKVQELSQRKMESFVREFEQSEKERRTMDFEKKMREIIMQNLSNPDLSSEMLADSLYVSRSGLFAKIKEITGSTPHQLIQDARLEEAARLLQEGTHTVHDVCEMVGFNSSNYFSKCFKQKYGCTPRDWNNQ